MKALAMLLLSAGLASISMGCYATPGYSAGAPGPTPIQDPMTGTHAAKILRNWGIDEIEATDDVDSALLMQTPSYLTPWDVR